MGLEYSQFWFLNVWFEGSWTYKKVLTPIFNFNCFDFWFLFVQSKANSAIEQQKCKNHVKCDRFLVSKVVLNFQISHRNRNFTYWSCFLKCGLLYQKKVSRKLFLKFKILRSFCFWMSVCFFSRKTSQYVFLEKQVSMFFCFLAFMTLFHLSVGYVSRPNKSFLIWHSLA